MTVYGEWAHLVAVFLCLSLPSFIFSGPVSLFVFHLLSRFQMTLTSFLPPSHSHFLFLPIAECGCHPSAVAGEAIKQQERPEGGLRDKVYTCVWLIIAGISEELLCKLCTHTDREKVIYQDSVVTCVGVVNSNIVDLWPELFLLCSFPETLLIMSPSSPTVSVCLSALLTQTQCMYFSVIYNSQGIIEYVRCAPLSCQEYFHLKSIQLDPLISLLTPFYKYTATSWTMGC